MRRMLPSADVVIIGAGAAGLCAAVEASKVAKSVLILDKCAKIGGNSQKASSGINGCLTKIQKLFNIDDFYCNFTEDTMTTGGGANDRLLVEKLVRGSTAAIDFLLETANVPLGEISQLGGHSKARTHRMCDGSPIGFSLVRCLLDLVNGIDHIQIKTAHEVVSIESQSDGNGCVVVTGVNIIDLSSTISSIETTAPPALRSAERSPAVFTIPTAAVVITTGGAACDRSDDGLMAEFAPQLRGMASSSGPQADGCGVRLGRQLGAALVEMQHVQVHPTGMIDPKSPDSISKFLAPEALRGSGGILVDSSGRRFADELARRGHLTNMISTHCQPYVTALSSGVQQPAAYLLLDEEAVEKFGRSPIGFYESKGLVSRYATAAEFATSEGIDPCTLQATLQEYCEHAVAGTIDAFGKTLFPSRGFAIQLPLWALLVTPVIHYSLGGLKIDTNANVMSKTEMEGEFRSIHGLYAAGECTGGVHGFDRLAGNSLLECVVFGRTAGECAASYAATASSARLR